MATASPPGPPSTLIDYPEFVVDTASFLGQGSFGTVMLGVHKQTRQLVAVKRIMKKASVQENVQKEIQALRSAPVHNNVVQFIATFDYEDAFYILLEYCEMGNLAVYYTTYFLGHNTSVEIAIQIFTAVAHLHDHNIMHRDVKPQNVMMTFGNLSRPYAKLADFGLAKVKQEDNGETLQTFVAQTGCGTPFYMAPELFQENPNYTSSVDVYACGMVLFWMIELKRDNSFAFVEMMKVVNQMTFACPGDRISAKTATSYLLNIYGNPQVFGALEASPGKPQLNLSPSLAAALVAVSPP